jgi:predicted NAD-dependent protein-ADP-ribosyltransferase YbiA (DUF1768 family)
VFHNVNSFTVNLGLGEPFIEFYVDNNKLQQRSWKNYQSYLLASKNPDGSGRIAPLTTTVAKPTEAVPYTHKQKYIILNGLELPKQSVVKPAETGVETYKSNVGDVTYKVTTDSKGDFTVELVGENPNIQKIVDNPQLMAVATQQLKDLGKYDELDQPIETAAKFAVEFITAKLVKDKVEVAPAPIALVVSDKKPVINIYWGSPESSTNTKVLSNLAPRKFTYQDKEYGSVEHAYQTLKSGNFDQVTYDKYVKAGGYGTKIRGKAVTEGFDNLQLMKDLVVESFKQNPNQAALLLNYSNFIGKVSNAFRNFHNSYVQYQFNKKTGIILGFDLGVDYINENNTSKIWYAPVFLVKQNINKNFDLTLRTEYYKDEKGAIVNTNFNNGFEIFGISSNIDYVKMKNALIRLEVKYLNANNPFFNNEQRSNLSLTTNFCIRL